MNYFLFAFYFIVVSFTNSTLCETHIFVKTSSGKVKGNIVNKNGKNFGVFLGIPYAKPPIGELRFKPPQPLDSNRERDTVNATEFSKKCVESIYIKDKQSEDCLYLNVATPTVENFDKGKYPVMVWIHGGGLVFGSASDYPIEGAISNFVSRGVVYVSINYRLNLFGFFTTKSSVAPGNYGMLDQVEALRWVHNNIAAFGGDPDKVTIFGESAGSWSVSFLTISPLTEGLFNQAIMMSGSSFAPSALMFDQDPYDRSAIVSKGVNCLPADVEDRKNGYPECLYDIPTKNVSEETLKKHKLQLECLQSKTTEELATQNEVKLGYAVRVDNNFLPQFPKKLMKLRKNLNLIIGVTKDETALFHLLSLPGVPPLPLTFTEEDFYKIENAFDSIACGCSYFKYPKLAKVAVKHHYGHVLLSKSSGLDEKTFWFTQTFKRTSAPHFWIPAYKDALEAVNSKITVYMYSYDYSDTSEFYNEDNDFYFKGAIHASDLEPLFDFTTHEFAGQSLNSSHPKTQRDRRNDKKTTETFGKLWTNFAKFGNPTPDDSVDGVKWVPFNLNDTNYLSIDMPKPHMKNNFNYDDAQFWTKYLPATQESVSCG